MNEQLQNAGRAAHDIGLATWFGGQVFGKFALNPVVRLIDDEPTRGKVVNAGWFTFNPVGVSGLALGGIVHYVARQTELTDTKLRPVEQKLVKAQDALLITCGVLTAATGIQGARLAKQAPEGAVPIQDGTTPSAQTPPQAAKLQRSIGTLGNANLLAGTGLLIMNALLDRVAFTDPPKRRFLSRSRI